MVLQYQVNKKDEEVEWYVDFGTVVVSAKTKEEAHEKARQMIESEQLPEIVAIELVIGQLDS